MSVNFDIVDLDLRKPAADRQIWGYGIGLNLCLDYDVTFVKKSDSFLAKIWFTFRRLIGLIDTSEKRWERQFGASRIPAITLLKLNDINPQLLEKIKSGIDFGFLSERNYNPEDYLGLGIYVMVGTPSKTLKKIFEDTAMKVPFVGIIDQTDAKSFFTGNIQATHIDVEEDIDLLDLRKRMRIASSVFRGHKY